MTTRFLYLVFTCCIFSWIGTPAAAQEKILASYFDIPINSMEDTEVNGRIHLERNKDVETSPIPAGYRFEILRQPKEKLFRIDTRYDLSKRIMGVLTVNKGKDTGSQPQAYPMTIALNDGKKQLEKFDITIYITPKTLWSQLYERYMPVVMTNSRLYGRTTYTDDEVADLIVELRRNHGRFEGERCYTAHPQDYKAFFDPINDHLPSNTIEYDWEGVVNRIGGLGYAYATSKTYGPTGVPEKRAELEETLYQALLAYTLSVPVDGKDVMINGKPIGNCTGDGVSLLQSRKMAGMQIPTHQWRLTDGLIVPLLSLMPDMLKRMRKGDETCLKLHDALIRYFQLFFAVIEERRAIDNPDGRWGELQDTLYSAGAWADANLGHRSRTMLALPIIWADYNRPLTYVQYWYSDYYKNPPFEGFSFSTGWNPHGVVADVSRWMTKYNIVAHHYAQSGFQPDGTISHHIGHGTDAAMMAYGFEWLTTCNVGYQYFKGTRFEIPPRYMQFQLDRLLNVYPHLFYKQRMDFLVSGRSYLSDTKEFTQETYINAVKSLQKAQSKKDALEGWDELHATVARLQDNTYEYSGTTAYWVNEFLVHRRGENEKPFYASLKLKSERTVGAEDFDKVRKSWHMGYGILPLKVRGDEYSHDVLCNFDWHALPGLTEEWRTDPMPAEGGAQASLPGENKISGVLADGKAGMGIYHHLPKETYSSATAFKSYHFIEDKIIAQGSGIARRRPGQQQNIATFIDQSVFNDKLTWCANGSLHEIKPGESVSVAEKIDKVCWLHQGEKGVIILPAKQSQLLIRTGKEINVTDRKIANNKPGFIIALNHGSNPGQEWDNGYRYVLVPNVTAAQMPERAKQVLKDLDFARKEGAAHAVYSAADKTWQYAFFKPEAIAVGNIEAASDDVAQVMLRDNGDSWILSAQNPMPDGKKQTLTFTLSVNLPRGTYRYRVGGVYPMEGETVTVSTEGTKTKVVVELPDNRDAAKYNYQSDLYAATPIVVTIPKK
jgi:chondroitin AC lyase